MHMQQWTKIITTSNPPVPDTPLLPYLPLYQLEEHGCALDGTKTKKVGAWSRYHPNPMGMILTFLVTASQVSVPVSAFQQGGGTGLY
jgi:hypothetical protein